LWHAVWCGLGDFGSERGFEWDDRAGHRFGIPIVNQKYGTDYQLTPGGRLLTNTYPPQNFYPIYPVQIQEYLDVVRDAVLTEIKSDPVWYAGIIMKRIGLTLNKFVPVRVTVGSFWVDFPFSPWLLFPYAVYVIYRREWEQAKLLVFFAPLSLVAILIYSGVGFTFLTLAHLVLFALLFCKGCLLLKSTSFREKVRERIRAANRIRIW
jgi:hypothetical protein